MPMLVNFENFLPEDYDPDTVPIPGTSFTVNSKVNDAYQEMLKAANRDGISLWVLSAYRSNETQTRNFNNKVQEYKNLGYTDEEAYIATAAYIAVPGTSEHSAGLAIDLNWIVEEFENTPEFEWLQENCADYGFILRYPKGKEDITKINYEPWHYRYVGSNHAQIIMESEMCLEEYLEANANES